MEIGSHYWITIRCIDPFTLIQYIHQTKAELVDCFFSSLHFWFDDAYGQECFFPTKEVISIQKIRR
ncbi:hypothetical protein MS2017_1385 [Bathymodiolus thermophilus thioautotrophic gill symbiont]|uniref:Uncharacterized protein n=1 Tax=Bathymodiolus thermophilus thioautotrophic gill symbiont TaxID=2360 RepID=A0A3G3IMM3_9GAMM|nr:hypothetical protein [Bathymodiolus thermophilus thioautotrophic gill symbiont]AYQ57073.1 hypothetical protein MS2017_1385 [Bathymodiolus thermophilus thioautotrophic gill symbiont]